jgi:uncharacterized protein YcbX
MHVSGLFIYPVKSLRGQAVPAADFDELGLAGDRRFLVVDPARVPVTQRTTPRMARIDARLSPGTLTLSADGGGSVAIPTATDPTAPLRKVNIWKSEGLLTEDCGPAAAAWLSDCLDIKCQLVRLGAAFSRQVLKPAARPGDQVSFADACPFLLISTASLANLNDRIMENSGEPIPMDRFRPNIVVDGCEPFAEDGWTQFSIGGARFKSAGKSDRCIMTTTDQLTGERGKEPLRTLATFRRDPGDAPAVYFGVNVIQETKRGTLRVGDTVTPL